MTCTITVDGSVGTASAYELIDPPRRHVRADRRVIEHRWERIEAFIPFDVDMGNPVAVYDAILDADLEVIDDEVTEFNLVEVCNVDDLT